MKSRPDTTDIKEALEKMCAHPLFINSSIYTRLISYLVEKALANENTKEYTIGYDLFGKNYSENKNDGLVRSYMYNLRKKLNVYYADDSLEHKVVFTIKKGQYNIGFVKPESIKPPIQEPVVQIKAKHFYSGLITICTLFIVAVVGYYYSNRSIGLWNVFFSSDTPSLVVVSDNYALMEVNQYGEKHTIFYNKINSNQDLFKYKEKNPERLLEITDFTMMSKMAPYGTKMLSELFIHNKSNYTLQLESELSLSDIQQNNLIFIGQSKTMNLSTSFFLRDSKVFTLYRDGYRYKNNEVVKDYNTKLNHQTRSEYAMVSFCSISEGKKALYFVSNNDIGVMATLRNFTDKEWLKEFYTQLPSESTMFNALFRVSGLKRTDIRCELVELEIL